MAIQSYEDIMARLNNPYGTMTEQPQKTAADDFTKYVQTLLLDPNPQGGMLDRDPFRRQNEIDARIKREQEEQAAKASAGTGVGMFGGSSSGGSDSGNNVQLTKEQLEFLEKETPAERYARITGDWFGLKPIAAYLAGGVPAVMAQQGYTPTAMMDRGMGLFRQAMGDTSGYQGPYAPKPAGVAAPVVSGQTNYNTYSPDALSNAIMETGTPYVEITPTFDWSSSGESSGGGGYSDGYSSSGGGGYTSSADGSYGGYI